MTTKNRWIFLLLSLVTVADLVAMLAFDNAYRFITKPLLMPLLIWAYLQGQPEKNSFSGLIVAGLAFAWFGDIFLMLEEGNSLYFIIGLCCFLTTHILYILFFLRIRSEKKSFFRSRPIILLVVVVYGIELLYLLWPSLGGMKLPVLIYAIVISTMLALAAWQYGRIADSTSLLFIFGAAFFVLSDSVLAINKFRQPVPMAGIITMITYVIAQTLIVLGALSLLRRKDTGL